MAGPRDTSDFSRWRRTSPFAIVFFIRGTITQIRVYGQLVATLGLAFLIVRARDLAGELIPVAILLIVLVAVLRYWFFRFRVTEDRILIRQGILKKTALDLPLDRVQAVNIERSLTDRVLGLVKVSVDTAGSGAVEAVIPSVKAAFADRIRVQVAAVRREGRVPRAEADRSAEGVAGQPDEEGSPGQFANRGLAHKASDGRSGLQVATDPSPGEVMMKLPPGDTVRIGLRFLGDSAFWVLPLALLAGDPRDLLRYVAGSLGYLEPISLDEVRFDNVANLGDLIFRAGFVAVLTALIATLAIYHAFNTYYGFKLYRQGAAYRTRAGLFTQREVVVQSVKVQQATLSQNIVDRCFSRFRLTVQPVSDDAEVLEIPLLGARMAEVLRARLFGREGGGLTFLPQSRAMVRVSAHYIGALTLKIAAAPALSIPAIVLLFTGPSPGWAEFSLIWALIWTLVGGLIALQRWRRWGYVHDDDGMAVRSGFVARKVDAFLFRKVQSVTVKQSLMQRRSGLATLEMQLAGESMEVPYIDHWVACRLRDYILYKVESNPRWH